MLFFSAISFTSPCFYFISILLSGYELDIIVVLGMSVSSSSFRTLSGRNPEKRPVRDVTKEPVINLDHLEILESVSDHGFSFLEEESEGRPVDPAPLSPQTLAFRNQITYTTNAEGVEEFWDTPNLGYPSVYTKLLVNIDLVRSWVGLNDRYRCVIPLLAIRSGVCRNLGCTRFPYSFPVWASLADASISLDHIRGSWVRYSSVDAQLCSASEWFHCSMCRGEPLTDLKNVFLYL